MRSPDLKSQFHGKTGTNIFEVCFDPRYVVTEATLAIVADLLVVDCGHIVVIYALWLRHYSTGSVTTESVATDSGHSSLTAMEANNRTR